MNTKEKTQKNKKTAAKSEGRIRVFKSISGKLVLLGTVAILSTVILGVTGISLINRNNGNAKVLEDINKISLLQNGNETSEVSFLYNLDNSNNETIVSNLESMQKAAADAEKYAGSANKDNIVTIAKDIDQNLQNMQTLVTLYQDRSFKSDSGLYAQFLGEDENLTNCFTQMEAETEWVDGTWNDVELGGLETVSVDGKTYRVFHSETEVPKVGNRDYIVIRVGNSGVKYTGNIYINNIQFDGNTALDLSGITEESLAKSYGEAYENLAKTSFGGKDSLTYKAKFSDASEDWQEASIEIPLAGYSLKSFGKVGFDLYFEETQTPLLRAAVAYNVKYLFGDNLSALNQMFADYSKAVAEGQEVTDQSAAIESKIAELRDAIDNYSMMDDVIASGTGSMDKISETFKQIQTSDAQIVQLKSDNNKVNAELTELASAVRDQVEKQNAASKISMMILIVVVFVVGLVLIVLLTLFVIVSVRRSITGFKDTLTGISEGKLSVRAKIGTGDEFDVFGKSLNNMADTLTGTLRHVNSAADELNNSGARLEEMAQSTSQTSEQIQTSIHGIASGATEQAENVEDSTNQIQSMGELMEQMVENVSQLDHSAENMEQASEEAKSILNELSESNVRMTEGVSKIADQIETTNQSVQEIREAVSLISSIASQTNLLSLNASIEAARAGEAGRGFAVVASEIQQLADQSNKSADQIYGVISTLTADFQQTMQIMENVQAATAEQNEKLEATQKQFLIVGEGISVSRSETSMIKQLIEECNQARIHISELMMNLSAISEENAASTTETADAMKTLNETFNELLSASQRFAELSSGLEQDMKSFEF